MHGAVAKNKVLLCLVQGGSQTCCFLIAHDLSFECLCRALLDPSLLL
jgi:hypothetical protein